MLATGCERCASPIASFEMCFGVTGSTGSTGSGHIRSQAGNDPGAPWWPRAERPLPLLHLHPQQLAFGPQAGSKVVPMVVHTKQVITRLWRCDPIDFLDMLEYVLIQISSGLPFVLLCPRSVRASQMGSWPLPQVALHPPSDGPLRLLRATGLEPVKSGISPSPLILLASFNSLSLASNSLIIDVTHLVWASDI